jgi:hypothetical protein
MAKHSMKVKGKEIGPAKVYAPPHTMDGKSTNVTTYSKTESGAKAMDEINMSTGFYSKGNYPPVNPYGTGVMRGMALLPRVARSAGKWGKS